MPAVLLPNGKQQYFTTAGLPAVGYKLATFASGTSTPQTTWADAAKIGANTNPIILDARGEAVIYWDGVYKVQLQDSVGAVIWTVDPATSVISATANFLPSTDNTYTLGSAAFAFANLYLGANHATAYDPVSGNIGYFARTAAEIAVPVVPSNFAYPPGHVLRYGANTTPGTTDMTAPIQAALNQSGQTGGARAYLPAGTYLVTAQLTQPANSIFYGDGCGSIINTSVTATDCILANNVANVVISDIKVNCTGTQNVGYIGAITYKGTTNGKVERCEVIGGYFIGIYVTASSTQAAIGNRVVGNYCHAATNTIQDSADIKVDSTATFGASFNIVDGNQCFGGANWMGIAVEASTNPNVGMLKNIVTNNRVGTHIDYGIILYTHTPLDTYNQVIGNYIENITGTALGGTGGQGIYVASMTAVTVANNTIVNCCNACNVQFNQGGITILSGFTGSPNVVTGNAIYDMAQGNANAIVMAGINVISTPPGTVVTGNLISQQTSFVGYNGIEVQGGNAGVVVSGNNVNILNTIASTRGIFVFANGANVTNVTISGNLIFGCTSRAISLEQVGGFSIINFAISGNTVSGGSAASVPLNVTTASLGSVTGNALNANTVVALNVSTAASVTYSGNMLNSSGANSATFAGTCTGSLFDDSNINNGGLANTATGMQVKQRTAVSPATLGLASVIGDMSTNTAGATPWGWQCTVTGTPGTWVALVIP